MKPLIIVALLVGVLLVGVVLVKNNSGTPVKDTALVTETEQETVFEGTDPASVQMREVEEMMNSVDDGDGDISFEE